MRELPIESKKEREMTSKSGLKDPGHLQNAANYVHGCRIGDRNYFEPPEGPLKEPNLTNGIPMLPQSNISSGRK